MYIIAELKKVKTKLERKRKKERKKERWKINRQEQSWKRGVTEIQKYIITSKAKEIGCKCSA